MTYEVKWTGKFKKSFKLAKKRGLDLSLLQDIIEKIQTGVPLDEKNRDHELEGKYDGFRECHIQPDWLLIYLLEDNVLTLTLVDMGTHSDLFDMQDNMRLLYMSFPICQTLSGKLSWSHYCELQRKLFFGRLLLSKGEANKEQVLSLVTKGIDYSKPEDVIRDPYVFEFLGIPENKPFLESDIEAAPVRQIENFL